jgi:DNA-binding CsgD family transcriptional regulator
MPERLKQSHPQFSAEILTLKTPDAVLTALQKQIDVYDLDVFGAWHLPIIVTKKQYIASHWKPGENLFFGGNIPSEFWSEYLKAAELYGTMSSTTAKGLDSSRPFTFAEAAADDRYRAGAWVFEVCRRFDIRDGFYCPFRTWNFTYSAAKTLVLQPLLRNRLAGRAHMVINQLESITKLKGLHAADHTMAEELSEREREVLQQRAWWRDNAKIAKELGISEKTVNELLQRARKKLGTPDLVTAALEAFKRGLILY